MIENVEFPSLNVTLRGKLYRPESSVDRLPAIIMAHGFSATINGMVAERYADVFCEAGFAVLLYDHYSFGISDGRPRCQISSWMQARGYCDAVDYLLTRPEFDPRRIAVWGDSMSGRVAIAVGAVDDRVKAVVVQVPACGHKRPSEDPDEASFLAMKDIILNRNLIGMTKKYADPRPVVSADQIGASSLLEPLTAFRWFIDYGGRYGTKWQNQAVVVTMDTGNPFHVHDCAAHLQVPILMVIAEEDEMPGANSQVSRYVYECIPGPKNLLEVDGGHFGLLYYPGELFDQVSRAQRDFLLQQFGPI
jgi:pimeloyl-ACP methyl ester carboxylesterase